MISHWVFERIADGLFLGPRRPLRHLCKSHRRGIMLDRSGVPLTADNTAAATTWRSHHAFSGRCGLYLDQQRESEQQRERKEEERNEKQEHVQNSVNRNGGGDVPQPETVWEGGGETIVSQSPDDYCTWIADFHFFSTSDEPHVLLSVAPHYAPLQGNTTEEESIWRPPTQEEKEIYDKRMLETPLIWEEPMTLSVDCTANGMYLWSEEWGFFGEKIADTCFEERGQRCAGNNYRNNTRGMQQQEEEEQQEKSYEAFVRLSWRMTAAGEHDARAGEDPSLHDSTITHSNENLQGHGEMVVFVRTGCSQDEVCNGRSNNNNNNNNTGGDGSSSTNGTSHMPPVASTPLASTASLGCLNGCKGVEGGERIISGEHVWRRVCERVLVLGRVPQEIHFVPYVTLMDDGDEVTIL
ncbi:hypothetical protein LSM04_008303 [Trypanosoma melophagium]|uniref:uncharacterized protein n=1 Tax=Trypanosoma melophagium TaxID=715481 RepID=UPI00351A0855|nr:hypothetical protein LSM04_008303 [Trypanosoma melophagium]